MGKEVKKMMEKWKNGTNNYTKASASRISTRPSLSSPGARLQSP